jgi:uncharacterized protein
MLLSMNILKLLKPISGNFHQHPAEAKMGEGAVKLIERALEGIKGTVLDCHAHVFGSGSSGSGCYINPEFFSWFHPVERLRLLAFRSGSMIKNMKAADAQYVERIFALADDFPGGVKVSLLAFDKTYREDGSEDLKNTKFYVPNQYVYDLVENRQQQALLAISVHPYRKDALHELDYWAERGIKLVKWLPNSQGMNPSHPLSVKFFKHLVKNKMILLGHAGKETAMSIKKFNSLGNPLLYRPALDNGVTLIMAHCAGLGMGTDLDAKIPVLVKNHKLFLRLMNQKQYDGKLYGDIAAITITNRMGSPLADVLKHNEFHHRMINGSDYPLPAINALISTKALQKLGYISFDEAKQLNEIYRKNPLTFDFVLKRTIRHPDTRKGFPASVFSQERWHEILKKAE